MKIPKSELPPFTSRAGGGHSFVPVLQKILCTKGGEPRAARRAQSSPALLLLSTNGSLRLFLGERATKERQRWQSRHNGGYL